MAELGVVALDDSLDIGGLPLHSRPMIFFQGDLFEIDNNHIRLKNLLNGNIFLSDFFVENTNVDRIDMKKGLSHVITFTATEGKIR